MRTIIVEDEQIAAQRLQQLIEEEDGSIEIIAVLPSVEETVEWISVNPMPDLIFMDIHLADGSSFSIFDQVEIKCPVIFTTAYDEYSLKAFEVNSIDYLLKPINAKGLSRALGKLKNFSARDENISQITSLMASFKQSEQAYKTHFLVPYKDKLLPIAIDQIAFILSEYKMARIVLLDRQSYILDTSLEELYKQLNPAVFFRANRQYIVSHRAIDDLSIWFNGKLSVNLSVPTPERIIVSRARVAEFKSWYTK